MKKVNQVKEKQRKIYEAKTKKYYSSSLAFNEARSIINLYEENHFRLESMLIEVKKSWLDSEENVRVCLKFSK